MRWFALGVVVLLGLLYYRPLKSYMHTKHTLQVRTEEVKAELQVPAGLTPNVAMCLGYAKAVPPTSERGRPPVIWVS